MIAQFDYIKAELPDVFFLNSLGPPMGGRSPARTRSTSGPRPTRKGRTPSRDLHGVIDGGSFVLPLGNFTPGLPLDVNGMLAAPVAIDPNYPPSPVTGVFGASFSAAGGIYKNLGYTPRGYDGVDNDSATA